MKRVIKIIGIVMVVIVIAIVSILFWISKKPAVPTNYEVQVETGGELEAKYIAKGKHKVKHFEQGAFQNFEKYLVYYPAELEYMDKRYPLIIVNNGTGVKASKAKAIFEHLASWGFIIVGTEEEFSWNGFSADMSLGFMLKNNESKDSVFYNKVDTENVGTIGHSQGGVGAINTVTNTQRKQMYKTVVAQSPTHIELAHDLEWPYNPRQINISILLTAATGIMDAKTVIPLDKLQYLYNQIEEAPVKVMLRRTDVDHGNMLYETDGYITAWFLWQLQGDVRASQVFIGENPELINNLLYQDIKIDTK